MTGETREMNSYCCHSDRIQVMGGEWKENSGDPPIRVTLDDVVGFAGFGVDCGVEWLWCGLNIVGY